MRYILALMIAVPLLMAGSAWAGEYDGEWSGSGVVQCSDKALNLDLLFIVDDGAVRGAYHKKWPVLVGSIEGHRIKAKIVIAQSWSPFTVSGSLQSGNVNLSGGWGCLGTPN